MKKVGPIGYPFVTIGIAFIAIGITGRRTFLAIGIAFIALGFVLLRRRAS